ncbi:MAG: hypothetical protein IJX31_02855 [Clostridia bacterium]|nr:hypothetical protein [Clostridia bacterium]
MSVEKIIIRSFLSTLAAIVMLLVFMVGMLVAVYPETMMNVSYDLGMEKASVWFAERAYKRHDKIETIAFATAVALEENMYDKILSCGDKMINDNEFADYCQRKDEENEKKYEGQTEILEILGSYDQYVYAQVSVAQYKTGDKDGAVTRAVNAVELASDFPKNNAIVCLLIEADSDGDETLVQTLLLEMETLYSDGWKDADKAYYNEIYSAVKA